MKLSKTSAHAALAMAFLASRRDDGYIQARTVADHLEVPTDSALKILQALTRRGLISSQLGRTGGYRMLMPADQVSLLQVVEAIDGPIACDMPVSQSHLTEAIDVLRGVCTQAAERMRDELANKTVADLVIHVDASEPVQLNAA